MEKTYSIDMDLMQNIALIDQGKARIVCAEKTIAPLIDDICNEVKLINKTSGYKPSKNQNAVKVTANRAQKTLQLKWIYDTVTLSYPDEIISFISDIAEMAHIFEVGLTRATMEKIEKQQATAPEDLRP